MAAAKIFLPIISSSEVEQNAAMPWIGKRPAQRPRNIDREHGAQFQYHFARLPRRDPPEPVQPACS
jgi:hypothetical protein